MRLFLVFTEYIFVGLQKTMSSLFQSTMALLKQYHTTSQQLPPTYIGKLQSEFDAVTALQELLFVLVGTKQAVFANKTHMCIKKFVHHANHFYFVMYGDKAPRFAEQDFILARCHAMSNIPLDASGMQMAVDQVSVDRIFRATSNIIGQVLNQCQFTMSQYVKHNQSAKAQCKQTRRVGMVLFTLLTNFKQMLDAEHEQSHAYVDKSTITYTDMTDRERKASQRKRRNR